MGHYPSDELTAFLKANRARSFKEFRQAFETYAVSAQNFLMADREGNIGHVLAYRQPLRPDSKNKDLLQPTKNFWEAHRKSTELPFVYNPEKGYLAYANNKPVEMDPEIGWFFESSNRVDRLHELADKTAAIDLRTLMNWQMDTFSPTGFQLKEEVVRRLESATNVQLHESELWKELKGWDGFYKADSRGAVAFETFMFSFTQLLLKNFK